MNCGPLRLLYFDAAGKERSVDLKGSLRIGRSAEAEVVIDGEGVSRLHCGITANRNLVEVRDLGSTNGTYVNGTRIETARLKDGDTLIVGRIVLRIERLASIGPEAGKTHIIPSELVELALDAANPQYPPATLDLEIAARHLHSLYGISRTISQANDSTEMFEGVLRAILQTLPLDFGHILIGPDEEHLAAIAIQSKDGGSVPPYSRTVIRRVLKRSEAVLANDIESDSDLRTSESLAAAQVLRIACAPIPIRDRKGALYVAARGAASPLREEDVSFLCAAAQQIGLAAQALTERAHLARENEHLKRSVPERRLLGSSPAIVRLGELIRTAAEVESTVLITGESGTGKELVARAIHQGSARSQRPFVAVNCGALPPAVVQSELFGHERGAFTGADRRRIGLVELADHGTLFLDEVGDLPNDVQVMLLRLLEEKRFYRVGGAQEIRVDVRFLAATNRPLNRLVEEQRFRTDLLYRLKVIEIRTPALREHPEDLDELTDGLVREIARTAGRAAKPLAPAARELLKAHGWPGNVRELRNVLERAMILSSSSQIEPEDLGLTLARAPAAGTASLRSLSEVERDHIVRILQATKGNKTRAAEILGVARITLYEKIKSYKLKPEP